MNVTLNGFTTYLVSDVTTDFGDRESRKVLASVADQSKHAIKKDGVKEYVTDGFVLCEFVGGFADRFMNQFGQFEENNPKKFKSNAITIEGKMVEYTQIKKVPVPDTVEKILIEAVDVFKAMGQECPANLVGAKFTKNITVKHPDVEYKVRGHKLIVRDFQYNGYKKDRSEGQRMDIVADPAADVELSLPEVIEMPL